ncbi:methyltransferase domain-containing protein [uncultured Cohaesibacter sp.]|uniref:methyltransferase domain-containing protein n=1 Tax=uncultured Cohaesibacter sp. TaxID=1002546 RepID=UPI002AA81E4C|nr:methyltransferase domain-containing protein [uncultured Cohaesibacter sp.]
MSGFDKEWLALREPVDRAARDQSLIEEVSGFISQSHFPAVIDIGCGTGATWRALSSHMPLSTEWLLLDHDPRLLAEAKDQIGSAQTVSYRQFDLTELEHLPLSENAIVTASAFFDLASPAFCEQLILKLKHQCCGLYAALNYNGAIDWSLAHPLDSRIVELFNCHQHTDKGFGEALGPDSCKYLADILRKNGYLVKAGSSPWHMTSENKDLQIAFLQGFPEPVKVVGELEDCAIEDWLSYRLSAIEKAGSFCRVGHTDLIAFPI